MISSIFEAHTVVKFLLSILISLSTICHCLQEFCYESNCKETGATENERFLLYDVNPPEGFNLRRDVYMRFAILAHKLKNAEDVKLNNFKLVLPPWSHLYHWKYSPEAEQIPWGLYFDLDSLKSFAPVIEMYEFFEKIQGKYSIAIDEVYILQHFKDMFESGNFEDRLSVEECVDNYILDYFYYKNITAKSIKCVSYHGPATKLVELFKKSSSKIILLHHAEVALHEMFGSALYWQCRRSMRFNNELQKIASTFRKKFLNSTDDNDRTFLAKNWRDDEYHRNALGGPYLGVHLRRKDFLRGRSHEVPSIEAIVEQIVASLKKLRLFEVFIATDATKEEYMDVVSKIPSEYKPVRYIPPDHIRNRFKDGGIAIIEQIICSHARHFIGTFESTFSFRIQEEREILGFPETSTFNSFCKENSNCPQPSMWKIVF